MLRWWRLWESALVEGNRENIKLTTPADLLLAKGIMEAR